MGQQHAYYTLIFTKLTSIPCLSAGVSIILDMIIPRPVKATMPVRYFSEWPEAQIFMATSGSKILLIK